MKLGSETNNLTNHLYSHMTKGAPEPTIGMAATVLCWTDRHAATVVDTWTNASGLLCVSVQEDKVMAGHGFNTMGHQNWVSERDPDAPMLYFRRGNDGRYREISKNAKGRWVLTRGHGLLVGQRDHYHDWSF